MNLRSAAALIGEGLAGIAGWNLLQRRHAILRNYPIVGHPRFIPEGVGPEMRQYIVTDSAQYMRNKAGRLPNHQRGKTKMTQTTSEMLRLRRVISDLMEKVRLSDLTGDELQELASLVVSDLAGQRVGCRWQLPRLPSLLRISCGLE